jgi:hypothetical protein
MTGLGVVWAVFAFCGRRCGAAVKRDRTALQLLYGACPLRLRTAWVMEGRPLAILGQARRSIRLALFPPTVRLLFIFQVPSLQL